MPINTKNLTLPAEAQAGLLTTVVFLTYMGQMLLNPIIAPLSREMGLHEWHIGATISLSAVVLAALSPFWGRTSQRLGAKRIFITGMIIAITSLVLFAAVSYLGMHKTLTGAGLVVGVLLSRGLAYGAGISAVSPTAQAHLVTHTTSEAGRVKAMGMIGAAQGMASIIGGIVGGGLAAIGGLLLPLAVMPVIMLMGIIVLGIKFHPKNTTNLVSQPKRIHFNDPRVKPWLISGLVMFLAFSSITTIFGFTIQDRFSLSGQATAGVSAIYLTIMGVTMIVGQAIIAPSTKWGASKLLRAGFLLQLLAVICLWPTTSHALLTVASILLGLGMGLAMPGYNTGPTLSMSTEEQGGVAGIINATNGAAYAIAPILSTGLYGLTPLAPFIISIALIATVTVYTHAHPLLRASR